MAYDRADLTEDYSTVRKLNPQEQFKIELAIILGDIQQMLIEKNEAYGDSALAPSRIFARSDAVEQIKVRIDDKLTRIQKGKAAGEDSVKDLLGYLVILLIAEKRNLENG